MISYIYIRIMMIYQWMEWAPYFQTNPNFRLLEASQSLLVDYGYSGHWRFRWVEDWLLCAICLDCIFIVLSESSVARPPPKAGACATSTGIHFRPASTSTSVGSLRGWFVHAPVMLMSRNPLWAWPVEPVPTIRLVIVIYQDLEFYCLSMSCCK